MIKGGFYVKKLSNALSIKLIFEKFSNINNFLCENRHSWSLRQPFTSTRNQKVHWSNNKYSDSSSKRLKENNQNIYGHYLDISLRLLLHSWSNIINIFPIDVIELFLARNVFIGLYNHSKGWYISLSSKCGTKSRLLVGKNKLCSFLISNIS